MPTRLQKVKDSNWAGAIFAKAGLTRLNLLPSDAVDLDWMLPAPAQGAVVVICRENDELARMICGKINHNPTEICTMAERLVLNKLNAGCSLPVGALATMQTDGSVFLKANVCSPDGNNKIEWEGKCIYSNIEKMVDDCAKEILAKGADKILFLLNKKLT